MRERWQRISLLAVVVFLTVGPAAVLPATAAPIPNVVYVATTGSDAAGCGEIDAPCQSIQHAVDIAISFDEIRVAEGVYRYVTGTSLPSPCYGGTENLPVVCILNKELTIVGGYPTGDWSNPDPAAHATVIDGEQQRRGILLQRTGPNEPAASLTLEGFVIENGLARGPDGRSGDATFAFGGGILADVSALTVSKTVFRGNNATGGNTSIEDHGGAGAGGGVAVRAAPIAVFEQVTFENNHARGGSGNSRGGFGIGGGLFGFRTPFYGKNLAFTSNTATAGNSAGAGGSGERADGQGGGAAFHESQVDLQYVVAHDNIAMGGNASDYGGGAYGGGLMVQSGTYPASIVLRDADLHDNSAIGGEARNGGEGKGGAMETSNAPTIVERVSAIHNTVRGGNGAPTGYKGGAGGGGFDFGGSGRASVLNSMICDNVVASAEVGIEPGGGGGGLWLYGVQAEVVHTTIARNRLESAVTQGQAVVLLQSAQLSLDYSIIEGHTSQGAVAAVHAQPGSSATLVRTLWANNSLNSNAGQSGAGAISNLDPVDALSAGFVSPGAPAYDYHLTPDAAAVDQAAGSTTPTDIDFEARNVDAAPDIGADEASKLTLALSITRPASGRFDVSWQASPAVLLSLDRYEVIVSCATGAARPDQVACDTPLDVGKQSSLVLTGLTDGKTYIVTVEAHSASRGLIVSASRESVPGVFARIFLPIALERQSSLP